MRPSGGLPIDSDAPADFYRRNVIRRLACSALAPPGELKLKSDVDLLAEFQPGRVPRLIRLAEIDLVEPLAVAANLVTGTCSPCCEPLPPLIDGQSV